MENETQLYHRLLNNIIIKPRTQAHFFPCHMKPSEIKWRFLFAKKLKESNKCWQTCADLLLGQFRKQ